MNTPPTVPRILGVAIALALLASTATNATAGVVNRDQLRRALSHLQDTDLLHALAVGGVGAMSVAPWDGEIVEFARDRHWLGRDAGRIGKWAGHRWTVGAEMLLVPVVGWAIGHDALRDAGLLLWPAQLATQAVVQGLKYSTRRSRPDRGELVSFPSGHASGAWTTATVLHDRFGAKVGVPAYAAALYIGLSRLQANKHHLSDVIFGFAVAHWCTKAVTRSAQDGVATSWTPRPTVLPSGDGMGLSLLRRNL